MTQQIDVLIVGQGLTGSLLALRLINLGYSVLVVDDGHRSSSSKIAAGMMNPVSGLRLSRLWSSFKDKEYVLDTYSNLEKVLDTAFIESLMLLRFLSKELEMKNFEKRLNDSSYKADLISSPDLSAIQALCDVGLKQFLTPEVYRMDVPVFLSAAKQFLLSRNSFVEQPFNYDDLIVGSQQMTWNSQLFSRVVFCEGAKGEFNPFFSDLDWDNSYGDVLQVSTEYLPPKTILNHGKWLCPIGPNRYKYGASAYWDFSNESQSQSEQLLRSSLSGFLKNPYQVHSVVRGQRPVFKQRSPLAFFHNQYPRLGIINGLGGTGISQAPLIIRDFVDRYFT